MEETTNNGVISGNNGVNGVVSARRMMDDEVQRQFVEKKWVWVRDDREAYVGGFVIQEEGDDVEVDCGGRIVRSKSCEVFRMNPPKFDMIDDLAELSYLNEAGVLHNLRRRYQNGRIYTYSGLFLLAINPYKELRIYGEKEVRKYTLNKKQELEPHIFAVANEAYRLMLSNRENQSILITGESGAGKTENTKRVVEFLAMVAGYKGSEVGIDRQIIDANPILEAFGNAQTVKNDNSSRFGKFIKIKFNGGNICGAHIEKYLLEKSRVTSQNKDERNYHVFYQLVGCDDDDLKRKVYIDGEPKDYRFLRGSKLKIPDVDDAVEFRRLRRSMEVLGISEDEQMGYFRIVSAILHLGNIEFGEKDGTAEIMNIDVGEKVCKLLSISVTEFIKCLIHPVIKAGNEYVTHNRSKEQVVRIIEGLARILYDKMFDNVIERLNTCLSTSYKGNFIGVLDIAGFEIFDENSFEQLCINYTNEKLQQFFNHHMFILEQEIYRQENIEWDFIDFGLDLQPTIDLIEKSNPIGILSYLDEECVMPMATEKTFLMKLMNNIKHGKFEVDKISNRFVLNHYAGDVEYVVEDWLSKNKDPHSESLTSLIQTSDDAKVSKLSLNETLIKKGFFRTVSQKHKEQLASLMEQLRGTNPHFVRCIIPNLEKSGEYLHSSLVLDQLKCNGVLEGIRISRQGFPSRMKYQEFVDRYRIITCEEKVDNYWNGGLCVEMYREVSEKILKTINVNRNQYRLGHTKVFFRQGILADIEDMKDVKVSEVIRGIQGLIRKRLSFRKYNLSQKRMQGITTIQRNAMICCEVQRWNWWRMYLKIKPLLDVRKKESEMKEKDMIIQSYMKTLEDERIRMAELNEELNVMNLKKDELEKEVEEEKRFASEKDELLMALRYKNENMVNEVNVLKNDIDLMKRNEEKMRKVVDELKMKEDEICRLRKAVSEGNEIIRLQESSIKDIQDQLRGTGENQAQIESILTEKDNEIRRLKDKIGEREKMIDEMKDNVKRLEDEDERKGRIVQENECIIEELKMSCDGMRKWKGSYDELKMSYETMQRRMKDDIEDVQLENDRIEGELKKKSKECEEMMSGMKKLKDDVVLERSRGDRLEKMGNELRGEYLEMEKELQKEKEFKDSTRESLLEKIKVMEKKMKSIGDRMKEEEMINKQLVNEREEMYKEMHLLQQSKLDEIFDREAQFNGVKKGLQMKIQKLEMENQRMSMEMVEMKANETSEESMCGSERMYMMVEEEKRKRKEIEHQLSEYESKNVVLSSEIESLKDMIEIERRSREEIQKDQERDMSVYKAIGSVRKEIDCVVDEMRMIVQGFNGSYLDIVEEYKKRLGENEEEVMMKEYRIEELNIQVNEVRSDLDEVMMKYDEMSKKNVEIVRKYDNVVNEFEMMSARSKVLEMSVEEKDTEIKRYVELSGEWNVKIEELVGMIDDEIENVKKNDDERRRYVEGIENDLNMNVERLRKMEEKYKMHAENGIKNGVEGERRKFRVLEESYNQLMRRFNDLQEEHRGLMDEKMESGIRIERLEGEICVMKENEGRGRNMIGMYESEINSLKQCSRFKDEMREVIENNWNQSVVHVSDKERYEVLDRKRLGVERELQNVNDEKRSLVVMNKKLKDEVEYLRKEIDSTRSQILEMKKNLGCQVLVVNRLTRELDEEREMAKFLKPFGIAKKKN